MQGAAKSKRLNECARGAEPGRSPFLGSRRSQCRSYKYLHRSVGTTLLTYIEHNVCRRVTLERRSVWETNYHRRSLSCRPYKVFDKTAGMTVTRQREADTNMG